jgi:hypothetical protein
MGSELGAIMARAGHDVVFSYSRSRKKLERLADAGAHAGTPAEAVSGADAVLVAVHWSAASAESVGNTSRAVEPAGSQRRESRASADHAWHSPPRHLAVVERAHLEAGRARAAGHHRELDAEP